MGAGMNKRRVQIVFVSALAAAGTILVSSHAKIDRMTEGDGMLHRAVAWDLAADNPQIQRLISGSGPALRYGRIGLPVTVWILSAGNANAMRYVQPLIMVLCAVGIALATDFLLPGPSIAIAMTPFLAVGLSVSIIGGFAEPLSIVCALWAIVLVRRDHPWPAATLFAAAMFARENAAAVLVGVALWEFVRGSRRSALILVAAGVPVVAWHLVVADRFGSLPLGDPWLVETGALGTPVINIANALGDVGPGGVVLIIAHLALAVVAFRFWRSSLLGAAAAASALPILSVGAFTWGYLGDAARLTAFLEVLVILALAERWTSRATERQKGPVAGHAVSR